MEATESTRVRGAIFGISILALGVIALVLYAFPGKRSGSTDAFLPSLNAALNASATCFLLAGVRFIRKKQIARHRACMLTALGLSSAFLVSYLIHHAQVGSVPFRGQGVWRTVYFSILIPHVILSAVVVPLALFTVYRAFKSRFDAHRRIARYTFPIWLYVSVSGVAVYLMLYRVSY
jgi:putative membrane protein